MPDGGGSLLSRSQDRSRCADPSRNCTLEVQIVHFMGKSFVIIVCNDLIQAGQRDTDPQGYRSALDPKTRAYVNVIVDETIGVHREPT